MMHDFTTLWVLVALSDTLALGLVIFLWRDNRRRNPSARLHFSVTDLLAATLGFAPTLALFAQLLKGSSMDSLLANILLALLIPNQIAGMLLMGLRDEMRDASDHGRSFQTSLLILGGAVLGMLLPVFTLTFFAGMVFAIALFVLLLPISLPVTLFLKALPPPARKMDSKAASDTQFPSDK